MERNPSGVYKIPEAQKSGKIVGRRVAWGLWVAILRRIREGSLTKQVTVVILPLKVLLNNAYDF